MTDFDWQSYVTRCIQNGWGFSYAWKLKASVHYFKLNGKRTFDPLRKYTRDESLWILTVNQKHHIRESLFSMQVHTLGISISCKYQHLLTFPVNSYPKLNLSICQRWCYAIIILSINFIKFMTYSIHILHAYNLKFCKTFLQFPTWHITI